MERPQTLNDALEMLLSLAEKGDTTAKVFAVVLQERMRQTEEGGWTPKHDDRHTAHELAHFSACYLAGSSALVPAGWEFKPRSHFENMVRGTALAVAEIERLFRLKWKEGRERQSAGDGQTGRLVGD